MAAKKGLPAKYAKMGFSKGWKAYKASKRKRKKGGQKMARKKTTRRRKRRSAPKASSTRKRTRRRRRRLGKLIPRIKAPRRPAQATMNIARNAAIGVAGAVGSAAAVRAMPIVNPQAKAIAQALIGAVAMMITPKRNKLYKLAGAGATIAGTLALTKEALPQLPLMAGYDDAQSMYMGAGQWKNRLARDPRLTPFNKNMPLMGVPWPAQMGVPTSRFKRGYGGQFALANRR